MPDKNMVRNARKAPRVAIVGGGKTPRYPKNKVMIWDDCKFISNLAIMKCII